MSKVGDVELLSCFLVSSTDKEITCPIDGSMTVKSSIHIINCSFEREFLGS